MRFIKNATSTPTAPGAKVRVTVSLMHGSQEILWDVKSLEDTRGKSSRMTGRPTPDDDEEIITSTDPFEHVNEFLAGLPEAAQAELFEVYAAIYNILENQINDISDPMRLLPEHINKLFDICPAESISRWVRSTKSIRFPSDIRVYNTLKESEEKGDQFGLASRPAEATYIKEDYWGLVVVTMMVRFLTPVWGHFLSKVVGPGLIANNLKEFYALRLAGRSGLIDADGYKRLRHYIDVYLNPEKFKNSVIGKGVSKEDKPFQALAMVLVRRLVWADFSGRIPNYSLIGTIHKTIKNMMENEDRHLNNLVRSKNSTEGGGSYGDQENRISVSEKVNIKEPYTLGDIIMMESAARNPYTILQRIAPDIPRVVFEQAMTMLPALNKNVPKPVQFIIAQNVLGAECLQKDVEGLYDAFFPPRSMDEMNLMECLNMMIVAATLLWVRGHHDIAALMTATAIREREGEGSGHMPPAQLTRENRELLQKHYPYAQRLGSKRRVERTGDYKQPALPNVAVENIRNIWNELNSHSWNLNLPKEWLNKLNNHGARRYYLKSDISNKFAELAISIATRNL